MKPTDLKCRPQVVAVIGEVLADYELQRVINCKKCEKGNGFEVGFFRGDSPQGYSFWEFIYAGQNPYDHGHEKPEVKEWVYCDGDWLNLNSGHTVNDKIASIFSGAPYSLPIHKSVTMPDWVPADLDKLDYNPEDVAFNRSSIKQATELFNKLYDKDITEDQTKALLVLIEHFSTTTQTPPPID